MRLSKKSKNQSTKPRRSPNPSRRHQATNASDRERKKGTLLRRRSTTTTTTGARSRGTDDNDSLNDDLRNQGSDLTKRNADASPHASLGARLTTGDGNQDEARSIPLTQQEGASDLSEEAKAERRVPNPFGARGRRGVASGEADA